MSAYGNSSGSGVTIYDGAHTYAPTSAEQQAQLLGYLQRLGYAGMSQVAGSATNTIGGIEQVAGGFGQVALAAIEIFGTDGGLTPLAAVQAAGGLASIYDGVQALTGSSGLAGTGGALSPTEQTQLADAATGTWYTGPSVPTDTQNAAAVWAYVLGNFGHLSAESALGLVAAPVHLLAYNAQICIDDVNGLYVQGGGLAAYYVYAGVHGTASWDSTLMVEGDTVGSAFVAQNTLYHVDVDGGLVYAVVSPAGSPFFLLVTNGLSGFSQFGRDYAAHRTFTPPGGGTARLMLADAEVIMTLLPVRWP